MNKVTRVQQQSTADSLGITLPALLAVQQVEARSSGFFTDGKPAILFERHIMYRQLLSYGLNAARLQQDYPDLVNRAGGGYIGGSAEHNRLSRAKQIHSAAAIESASWGLFQIMGFHWKLLGYDSASHFERCMSESEQQHLQAFCTFIKANPAMQKALQQHNWAEFARRYNGPNYQRNNYDSKLAAAYTRFKAKVQS